MRIEDLKQMKVKLLRHFASTLVFCLLVKLTYFCFSPTVVIVVVLHKLIWDPVFLSPPPQAYLKHLKKQQKELNSLKKKHAKVQWFVWASNMCV